LCIIAILQCKLFVHIYLSKRDNGVNKIEVRMRVKQNRTKQTYSTEIGIPKMSSFINENKKSSLTHNVRF